MKKVKPYGGKKKKYYGSYPTKRYAKREAKRMSKAYTGTFYVVKNPNTSYTKEQWPGKYLVKRK